MARFKVFIAESNNPLDFYLGKLDGYAANEILKVRRIASRYRIVFDLDMFRRAIRDAVKFEADIFHLSCHGDAEGVDLADGSSLSWEELAEEFAPLASVDRILVNSSCQGAHKGIATAFREAPVRFGYLCGSVAEDGVAYTDSCLAWSILYNILASKESISRRVFQEAIDKVNGAVSGDFVYRRWDTKEGRYLVYPKQSPDVLAALYSAAAN
jgi:hypothetical protein